jgi:hypothetical protein
LVTKDSATFFYPHEALHNQIPIDTDHSNLVKFPGPDDRNYETVSMKMRDLVMKAAGIIQNRGKHGILLDGQPLHYNANSLIGSQPATTHLVFEVEDDGTALCLAAQNGHEDRVRFLLDHKADIRARRIDGTTALHVAAWSGHEATVRLLLERNADIQARRINGATALHEAAWCGHEATVRLLLDRKADIQAKQHDGWTALHAAAYRGYETMVRLLLERNADIHAKSRGRTALHMATSNGHEATVQLLRDH